MSFNPASLSATSQETGASTTASVSAIIKKQFQVHSFSGGASSVGAQPYKVELKFGTAVKMTLYGSAGTSAGHTFTDGGPISAENEAISVVTTPDASSAVSANVSYKVFN